MFLLIFYIKVFPNKDMLLKHNKIQCENTVKPFRCATCDMKFVDEVSFNDHTLKRHKGESVSANFIQLEDIIEEKLNQYIVELKEDDTELTAENVCKFNIMPLLLFFHR